MGSSGILEVWCPQCGGPIHEHTGEWRCAKCDFKLPAFRNGQRRDAEDIEREVRNIAAEIAGTNRTVRNQPGKTSLGRCPRCGSAVVEMPDRYACEKSIADVGACKFRMNKTILSQPLDRTQVQRLLTSGRTDLLTGFVSKSGRQFPAFLVVDETGKVTFEFPEQAAPAANQEPASEPPPQRRPTDPCKPLLSAATPAIFRRNAFRITGLPVEASTRQVAKHAANLGQMAELGLEASHQAGLFAMKPPPTLDEVREAVQRLKDPESRLIDELFWFWPCQTGSALPDPGLEALASNNGTTALRAWQTAAANPATAPAAAHNTALFWHLNAIDAETQVASKGGGQGQQEVETPWRTCLAAWGRLADDDGLWERLATHAKRIDDPRLKPSFLRSMRATLPLALAKINAELALSHAESGRKALATMHVHLVREADQGGPLLEEAGEIVLTPLVGRLRESIKRTKETTQDDPVKGADAVRHLLEHAKQLPDIFDLFYGEQEHSAKEILDEAATTCIDSLVSYQKKTEDNRAFVDLLQAALPLADAVEVRQRIEKNIEIGKNNLAYEQIQPLYETLKKVVEDPPPILSTGLGFISDTKAKFNRVRTEILPALEELKKKFGVTSDVTKRFSDDVAIAMRGLAVQSCERYNDFRTASDILKLCLKLCYDPELKRRLKEDMSAVNDLLGEGTCYYCDKNPGVGSAKLQIPMYRVTSYDSDGTRYQTIKVKVPRCRECRKAHRSPWAKTWRGAVPAGTIATILLPVLFGTWGGSRLQDTIVNGTIGAVIGGVIAFFVAEQLTARTSQVKPKYAALGPDFGHLTALRRLGSRPRPKPIESHHKIRELRSQGWSFGATPRSSDVWLEAVAIRQMLSDCTGALARLILLIPLRPPWSPNATWIGITAALFVIAAIYTPPSATTPPATPPAAPVKFIPDQPAAPRTTTTTPATRPSPPPTSPDRTYRVPSTVSYELDNAKQQITLEKAKAEALDTKLTAAKQALEAQRSQAEELGTRVEALGAQIDRDRIYLDRSSQSEIDDFNAKVGRYNTLLRTFRAENATANEMVDSYNTLLEAAKAQDRVVNQLIDSYNAKLRSYGR
ncbi:MAG TPA: topoisomerase C-terminal repeat-containing protein [Verrucomicrobiota bacterium]|nr:topoisomerase C-terminal repeat-containing protein [Verrucomicrobiota bacterium]